jgi:hypothetical protein
MVSSSSRTMAATATINWQFGPTAADFMTAASQVADFVQPTFNALKMSVLSYGAGTIETLRRYTRLSRGTPRRPRLALVPAYAGQGHPAHVTASAVAKSSPVFLNVSR